jgi:hypothetical protein
MFMNALTELGLVVAEQKSHGPSGSRDSELIELGSVVSETKGHCHGTFGDPGLICRTTSPVG